MLFISRGTALLARELGKSRLKLELLGISGYKNSFEHEKDLLASGRKEREGRTTGGYEENRVTGSCKILMSKRY